MYAGQTSIEKNLEKLQALKEEQMRSIQGFHKKIFLPAMVTLASLLGEQASSVTNMGVDLITKVTVSLEYNFYFKKVLFTLFFTLLKKYQLYLFSPVPNYIINVLKVM